MRRVVIVLGLALPSCVGAPPAPPAATDGEGSSSATLPPVEPGTSSSEGGTTSVLSADGTSTGRGSGSTGPAACVPACAADEKCLDGLCVAEGTTSGSSSGEGTEATAGTFECQACVLGSCAAQATECMADDQNCECCWLTLSAGMCQCMVGDLICEAESGVLENLLLCAQDNCSVECGLRGCNFEPFPCIEPILACQ